MIIENNPLGQFFQKTERQFIGEYIDYTFATNAQLNIMVAEGLILYNKLYPPKKGFLDKVGQVAFVAGVVVIAVGAAAVIYSGVAVAAAPAVAQVTAVSTAVTESVAFTAMQTTASAITTTGAIVKKVTGKEPSAKLQEAADIFNSETVTDTIKKGVAYQLKKENIKLDPNNRTANAALNERIKREQAEYAGQLRNLADEQRAFDYVEPKKKINFATIATIATPFALLLFRG